MSSLAELPELVGFFSYSRDDDADSLGALSALRSRIQGELRGQLGRTARTFRLWQDKEAIPSGRLWETEIKNAVAQSVFFIPIITPTVVASPYCKFELESFLAREAALGRDDLVFPILYIDVPGLEDGAECQNDPVLSLIAKRQYADWRKLRHTDARTTDTSEAVERFCTHIRDALRRSWLPLEERKQLEEAAAQQQAETERLRREVEAKRRADEEARQRRREEEEAKRRAEEEERRRLGRPHVRPLWPPSRRALVAASLIGVAVLVAISTWVFFRAPGPGVVSALSSKQERVLQPKDTFNECTHCPQMIVVPAGSFTMGSPTKEPGRGADEGPQHRVTLPRQFAVGTFNVTHDEFAAFVTDTGYDTGSKCYIWTGQWTEKEGFSWRNPGFEQTGSHPVVCVSWSDAQTYVNWLSKKTGKEYRLLNESEWEYAARAGSTTIYYWGDGIGANNADCGGCGSQWDNKGTAPVGSFKPNAFGLYDIAGNVWEWTEDCYHDSYNGAPADGSPWTSGECSFRVVRGGSWPDGLRNLRSANRYRDGAAVRSDNIGFRVGRTLLGP
jgi:formylglycine-generating enzyme required for sulfatase activity